MEDNNCLSLGDLQIRDYPKGYDLSLLQTVYHKRRKIGDNWEPDQIDLVIKDNVSGEKFVESITNPLIEWYKIKPEIYVGHHMSFADKEDCETITCYYTDILKSIAEHTDQMNFYNKNRENGDFKYNNELHIQNRVMGSDMDIEDFYRFKFGEMYKNSLGTIDKSYLDIEVDSRTAKGDFVEPGECPINAVTFIDDKYQIVYTFLLRDEDNPLCLEFERQIGTPGFYEGIKKDIINLVGGEEKAKKYKVDTLNYNMMMFSDEKQLIVNLFEFINKIEPDFLLAWNMSFDIPYIIERCKKLAMRPELVMCHPDFDYKEVLYFIDRDHYNEFAERNDFFRVSSKTVYLDQMIHFASRRKGRSAIPNFRLDSIADMTVGFGKLDYHHICDKLEDLPQINYRIFVLYNIMDVISQYCIEGKCNDVGNAYNMVLLNNTRMSKIYRQTVYLKNRAFKSYWRKGFVMGNNTNKKTPKAQFPGAWVSDPTKVNDYSKIKVFGKPINVYDNLSDFDYTALYPSIESENNMSDNNILAHINIPVKVYADENRFARADYKYKREGQFLEDLQSHQWLEFFHRWFHLASYREMYDDLIFYYTTLCNAQGELDLHNSKGRMLFTKVPNTTKKSLFINIAEEERKKKKNKEYPHTQYEFTESIPNFETLHERIQSRGENTYNINMIEV